MRAATIIGLDLGQSNDFTALSIIQPSGSNLHIRHLERFRHKPYTEVVTHTAELLLTPALVSAALVIDRTGVGTAVYDQFRAAGLRPIGISIHGGDAVAGNDRDGWRVPKRDLIAAAQIALQNDTLKVAEALDLAQTLVAELLNYRLSISLAGHDSYGAGPSAQWREGAHDDLLLSVALAVWYATRARPSNVVHTWS